jgi:hypothetical protein
MLDLQLRWHDLGNFNPKRTSTFPRRSSQELPKILAHAQNRGGFFSETNILRSFFVANNPDFWVFYFFTPPNNSTLAFIVFAC